MSASQSVIGFGSTIKYAAITGGTPGSYTKVMQTVDISSPTPEVGDVKVTNNDSPNNSHEYAVGGLIEPGQVDWEVVFFASEHLTLLQMNGDGIIRSWQELFPDGTTCTFPGYVKSAGVEGKTENEALKGKVTVKITGPVVWAAAA